MHNMQEEEKQQNLKINQLRGEVVRLKQRQMHLVTRNHLLTDLVEVRDLHSHNVSSGFPWCALPSLS